MNIQLLALDMDGTTLKDDHQTLSPANRQAIERALEKGIQIVIATGRVLDRLPKSVTEIHGLRYAITSNGAAVTDLHSRQTLHQEPLPAEDVMRVLDIVHNLSVYIQLYCNGRAYTESQSSIGTRMPHIPSPRQTKMALSRVITVDNLRALLSEPNMSVEKINLPLVPPNQTERVAACLAQINGIEIASSSKYNFEITRAGVNKKTGLQWLCHHLQIAPEQVMAMGDSGNDYEMMKYAGFSVAPANADPAILKVSDFVTVSNEQDAVAAAIERFL